MVGAGQVINERWKRKERQRKVKERKNEESGRPCEEREKSIVRENKRETKEQRKEKRKKQPREKRQKETREGQVVRKKMEVEELSWGGDFAVNFGGGKN